MFVLPETPGDFTGLCASARSSCGFTNKASVMQLSGLGVMALKPGVLLLLRRTLQERLGELTWTRMCDLLVPVLASSEITGRELAAFWSVASFSDPPWLMDDPARDPEALIVAHVMLTILRCIGVNIRHEHILNLFAQGGLIYNSGRLLLRRRKGDGSNNVSLRRKSAHYLMQHLHEILAQGEPDPSDACGRFADEVRPSRAEEAFTEGLILHLRGTGQYVHAQRMRQPRRAFRALLALFLRRFGYTVPAAS